jgi:hypothetical protein
VQTPHSPAILCGCRLGEVELPLSKGLSGVFSLAKMGPKTQSSRLTLSTRILTPVPLCDLSAFPVAKVSFAYECLHLFPLYRFECPGLALATSVISRLLLLGLVCSRLLSWTCACFVRDRLSRLLPRTLLVFDVSDEACCCCEVFLLPVE